MSSDDGVADGASADDHIVADAVERGRGRGRGGRRSRGRGRGFKWTSAQRSRIVASKSLGKNRSLETQNDALQHAMAPSHGEYVSSNIFGAGVKVQRGQDRREWLVGGDKVASL